MSDGTQTGLATFDQLDFDLDDDDILVADGTGLRLLFVWGH